MGSSPSPITRSVETIVKSFDATATTIGGLLNPATTAECVTILPPASRYGPQLCIRISERLINGCLRFMLVWVAAPAWFIGLFRFGDC